MEYAILLCTDLDRTLIPNGPQPESPDARPRFAHVAARPDVVSAYVSGRSLALVEEAIRDWSLPIPDHLIGDVGTTLYHGTSDGRWAASTAWQAEIGRDWLGRRSPDLAALLGLPPGLTLQEPGRQNDFKLSYYAPGDYPITIFRRHAASCLREAGLEGLRATVIWSVDETRGQGLIDVIPERATKRHAVEFLIAQLGIGLTRCLYAGDSGNDLPILASPVPSVLVRNATEAVRREALREAASRGNEAALYLARGGFLGMNGNYAAGILEGLVHFMPETANWL